MKRLLLSISILAGLLLVPFISGGTAYATVMGGKWGYTGSFTLNYNYPSPHRYNGNVWQGAANWSATATNANISPWQGIPFLIQLDVVDVDTPETWWGLAQVLPCSGTGCTYEYGVTFLNQRTLDPENDFTRTKVATHEFGHLLGLNHPSGTATSVMNQGYLGYNTPQTYDINDINSLY